MSAELVCAATDPAWLERRREGITATDIVTIAGLVTWDSPWALYHRKLCMLPEVEQSDRMRLGSWLEEAIAHHWSNSRWGMPGPTRPAGLYRNTQRLWQMATPDRLTRGNDVLECKTSATRQGWGDDGSDEVPAHVRAQVLWQMDTLGVAAGHVAVVFLPSGEFRSYTIRHATCDAHGEDHGAYNERGCLDCPACLELDGLRDLGFGFWSRILTRRPPDLDGLEVTTDALRYLHPAPHDSVAIPSGLIYTYDLAAEDKKRAEADYRLAQNNVRAAMGDATEATHQWDGGRVVFRRTIGKRAGYTVPPGEVDTLRRIGKDKDSGPETAA